MKSISETETEDLQKKYQYVPFFSKFNTSKMNILIVLTTLRKKELNLLAKKHGYDLENITNNEELTNKENDYINQAITKKINKRIKELKKGTHIIITITDILPENINVDYVLNLFKTLKKYEVKIFTNLFGENLQKRAYIRKDNLENLKIKLSDLILRYSTNMKRRHKEFIPFIEIFKGFRKEKETDENFLNRIKIIIESHCDEYEISLLHKKYGIDYQNTTNNGQFTQEENLTINHLIIYKIKYYLKKEKRGTIYCKPLMKRLIATTTEEALAEIEKESEKNKQLLKRKYKEDYLGVTPRDILTKKENKQIKNIIMSINRRIEKNRQKNEKYCIPLIARFDKLTTIDEVLYEINRESEKNQNLLKKKYKDNYLGVTLDNSLTKEENEKIKKVVQNIKEKINNKRHKKTGICKNTLIKIRELLKTNEYMVLAKIMGEREAVSILVIKYLSLELSLDSLSLLTNLDKCYILKLTKAYIEKEEKNKKETQTLGLKNSGGVTQK